MSIEQYIMIDRDRVILAYNTEDDFFTEAAILTELMENEGDSTSHIEKMQKIDADDFNEYSRLYLIEKDSESLYEFEEVAKPLDSKLNENQGYYCIL